MLKYGCEVSDGFCFQYGYEREISEESGAAVILLVRESNYCFEASF